MTHEILLTVNEKKGTFFLFFFILESYSRFSITHLELSLEEELLRTLGAVVYLVLLSVDGKDVLLQLIGLNKHWGEKTEGK